MAYLNEVDLANRSVRKQFSEQSRMVFKNSKEQAEKTIFLSHSHFDKKIIEGLKDIISEHGYSIYIDSEDSGMPEITNRTTAEKIKAKIKDLDYFWILATNNALNSKWVPWEIGIADMVNNKKIFTIPINDKNGNFKGNEYLQLYKRLIISDEGKLAIFEPNQTTGKHLKEYLGHGGVIYG